MAHSQIEHEIVRDIRVLRLSGEFGPFEMPRLAEHLDAALREGARSLVVNLRNVRRVDLSTLGSLARTQKRLRQREGELVVSDPAPALRPFLRALGLEKAIRFFPTDAEAVRHLEGAAAGRSGLIGSPDLRA